METLAARIARAGALQDVDAVAWAIRLAKNVERLHAAGKVHGHVSPRCVRLSGDSSTSRGEFVDATQAPYLLAYHSPERAAGEGTSPEDDTWGIAITLYEALTACQPFVGGDESEVRRSIEETPIPSLAEQGVGDAALQDVLDRALVRDLDARISRAAELRAALEAWRPSTRFSKLPPLEERPPRDTDDEEEEADQDAVTRIRGDIGGLLEDLIQSAAVKPASGPVSSRRGDAAPRSRPGGAVASPERGSSSAGPASSRQIAPASKILALASLGLGAGAPNSTRGAPPGGDASAQGAPKTGSPRPNASSPKTASATASSSTSPRPKSPSPTTRAPATRAPATREAPPTTPRSPVHSETELPPEEVVTEVISRRAVALAAPPPNPDAKPRASRAPRVDLADDTPDSGPPGMRRPSLAGLVDPPAPAASESPAPAPSSPVPPSSTPTSSGQPEVAPVSSSVPLSADVEAPAGAAEGSSSVLFISSGVAGASQSAPHSKALPFIVFLAAALTGAAVTAWLWNRTSTSPDPSVTGTSSVAASPVTAPASPSPAAPSPSGSPSAPSDPLDPAPEPSAALTASAATATAASDPAAPPGGAQAAPTAASPSAVPTTATSSDGINACMMPLFPDGTFVSRRPPDFAFVCGETDPRRGAALVKKQVVLGAEGSAVSDGMREWALLGWYELATFAALRARCCPGAEPLTLPATPPPCGSLDDALNALGTAAAAATSPDDPALSQAQKAFSESVHCLVRAGGGSLFGHKNQPQGGQDTSFKKTLARLAGKR
ncbi:hypothetical protein [Chondromyces crocatus]|uniref:Protein kinase domain-containing protein n=1 Tax=Chondromyces crocatus TaxID=52 RepID=A0A0K1E5R4_CHOCO|nr:hypothetical protein [Chondromyces crocatus]AKT36215.1 uncharacterized protein CMC5_003290 [Chondromyces crocatus]